MDGSTNHADRPAKKCKVAGRVSYGSDPLEFTGINKEIMFFDIHNFADLQEKRGKCIKTETIRACGHVWKLKIFPRGNKASKTDAEYTGIYLCCADENIETNPVHARVSIRTKTMTDNLGDVKYAHTYHVKYFFHPDKIFVGFEDFKKREDIIQQDLNQQGTLTIEIELEIPTEKREVWAPNTSNINKDVLMKLYESIEETSDVTFLVGPSKVVHHAHKNILAVQARDLYDLVIAEEESSSSTKSISTRSKAKSENAIVLQDVDANAFEVFLKFVYGMLPDTIDTGNDDDTGNDGDVDIDTNEEQAKSILLVADRFGCTDLKLHTESYLLRKVLLPSKVARLLLMADSHSLPLLKEACMDTYILDPKTVQQSEVDWNQLQESTKLLVELLNYATTSSSDGGRKKYSSYINDGKGTIAVADEYDVTSLRERLEAYDLDLDGSREMLLHRWKNYLVAQRGNDDEVDSNNARS